MNKILLVFVTAMLGMAVCSSASFAAGFRLPDQDSAALGMAGAFAGQADNPSAAWYNPAGMIQLDGTRVSGGVIGIYPVLTHENTNGTTDVSSRDIHLPVHLYATHRLDDRFAFGVSINNPFGLSTDWNPETSATRYVATFSKIVTTEVNPNFAYKLNDDLSVAFGIAYVQLRATLEKTINLGGPSPAFDRNFRLSGEGDGWGFNAAAMYKIAQNLHAGLSYRSRIKIDVDGDAGLTGGPAATSATGSTSITLPDLIQLGVSYKASDKLTLNADLDYTMWSTYDRIVITSDIFTPLTGSNTTTDEKQWDDVWCLRLGGQYQLSDQWKLRAGYVYDKSPVGESHFDTRTPDSDRQGVSIGTGYEIGNMTVDLAYMYLRFNNRTISNSQADNDANPLTPDDSLNGTYKSQAQIAGITVGYKF